MEKDISRQNANVYQYLRLIACNFTENGTPQKLLSTALARRAIFLTVGNHLQEHTFFTQTKERPLFKIYPRRS